MSKKNNRKNRDITETSSKVEQVVQEATSMDSRYDPNGSYTGRPVDGDHPTQDADDL